METQQRGVPMLDRPVLRRFIPRRLQPLLRGIRKRLQRRSQKLSEPYYSIFPYTMAHPTRQENIVRLGKLVDENKVAGAVVECGVLDGGMAALAAYATRDFRPTRPVHLFDAWEGLPPPSSADGVGASEWAGEAVGSPRRVARAMKKLGIEPARLHFHRGWFDQTFPHVQIDPIALLHLDADFYDPTKLCLQRWYDFISPGGYMQIDDYDSYSGCRRAIDEFLAAHPQLKMETVEAGGAKAYFIRKPDAA